MQDRDIIAIVTFALFENSASICFDDIRIITSMAAWSAQHDISQAHFCHAPSVQIAGCLGKTEDQGKRKGSPRKAAPGRPCSAARIAFPRTSGRS